MDASRVRRSDAALSRFLRGSGLLGALACAGGRRRRLLAAGNRLRAKFLREPLNPALGIQQLLPAREERVAIRADLQVQLFLGRLGLPCRTAGAPGLYLVIIRMNAFLHDQTPFKETMIIPDLTS